VSEIDILRKNIFNNLQEIEEKDKEIERLNKEKIILENALKFVLKKDDNFKIDYKQLEKDLKELKEGKYE